MDEKFYKLIEEKGPEIAKQLQIASTQVYDKVLWYIRIDGAIGLITSLIGFVTFIVWAIATHVTLKKNGDYKNGDPFMGWLFSSILLLVIFLMGVIFYETVIINGMKMYFPEYWLIRQIITKR